MEIPDELRDDLLIQPLPQRRRSARTGPHGRRIAFALSRARCLLTIVTTLEDALSDPTRCTSRVRPRAVCR